MGFGMEAESRQEPLWVFLHDHKLGLSDLASRVAPFWEVPDLVGGARADGRT